MRRSPLILGLDFNIIMLHDAKRLALHVRANLVRRLSRARMGDP